MENKNVSKFTPVASRRVPVGDLEIYYEEYGSGEPLVLVHGFGGSGQTWGPFIPELAPSYRLIVVDLRGHGRSTNPQNRFTHRSAAADIFQLLDHLKIDRFQALGISSGGMTLLHMAVLQPDRLNALVLVSATSHFPDQARTIMGRVSRATMPAEVRSMYESCATRGEDQILQLISQFNAFKNDHEDMNFTPQDLGTIKARTLVVHGDRDQFFPVEIAVDLYRSIPRSSLWIIPGGGHVPIYDPTVPFTSAVLQFLADQPRT